VPDSTSFRQCTDLQVLPVWRDDAALLAAVRGLFTYGPGEDRATGNLFGDQDWPPALAEAGPARLGDLEALLGIRFTHVVFQAYRNGAAGCDWHADTPFDAQAILSLGATRTFGIRRLGGDPWWTAVNHGDLVVMPAGFQAEWEHCVPVEDERGERVSLVFRTVARS
jgi:alkylated DNA repair dioxygenase AlkB